MGCLLSSRQRAEAIAADNPEEAEETALLSKFKLPSWEQDVEASSCFGCQKEFTALRRRHHCRRCGNVFCDPCSQQRAKLLLFAIREPARVCDRCFVEAPQENEFVDRHAPRLRAGANVQRTGFFGATPGSLRVSKTLETLTFTESKSGSSFPFQLKAVEEVRHQPRKDDASFTLVVALEHDRVAEHTFRTTGSQECGAWVRALTAAVKHARRPAVAEQVETERKKKREEQSMRVAIQKQFESREKRTASNQKKRDGLASKYGLRGK